MRPQIEQWFEAHIVIEELDKKVKATLEYVKRFNEPDDGDWVVWAHEIVSGAHGQYTVRIFLDEVINGGSNNHETADKYMDIEDMDIIMRDFDEAGGMIAELFNKHTNLPGKFYVSHNEADGSLGVFYYERAER